MLNQEDKLKRVLQRFALLWLLCGIGVALGQFVPPPVAKVLSIIAVIVLIATMFLKLKAKTLGKLIYIISIIIGIGLYYSLTYYLAKLGISVVLQVFIATAIIFIVFGMIGYKDTRNRSSWGKYLFYGLLAVILVSIINIFVGGTIMDLIISIIAVIIFVFYTIFDFNQIKHQEIHEDEVTSVAFDLFLDFLNLFLNLLRIVDILSGDGD